MNGGLFEQFIQILRQLLIAFLIFREIIDLMGNSLLVHIAVGKLERSCFLPVLIHKLQLRPRQVRIGSRLAAQFLKRHRQSLILTFLRHPHARGSQLTHGLHQYVPNQLRSSGSGDEPGGLLLTQNTDQALGKSIRIFQTGDRGITGKIIIQIQNFIADASVCLLLPL